MVLVARVVRYAGPDRAAEGGLSTQGQGAPCARQEVQLVREVAVEPVAVGPVAVAGETAAALYDTAKASADHAFRLLASGLDQLPARSGVATRHRLTGGSSTG